MKIIFYLPHCFQGWVEPLHLHSTITYLCQNQKYIYDSIHDRLWKACNSITE